MKKLLMLASMVMLALPFSAFADRDREHHHHIRANEVAGISLGAAAFVGLAGYFLLRRRHE